MKVTSSQSHKIKLVGSYSKAELSQDMRMNQSEIFQKYQNQLMLIYDIPLDVSKRLLENYGTASLRIVKNGQSIPKYGSKVSKNEEFNN